MLYKGEKRRSKIDAEVELNSNVGIKKKKLDYNVGALFKAHNSQFSPESNLNLESTPNSDSGKVSE